MHGFFTRERFGRPQFLAGMLLLAFLGQAVWLVHAELRPGNQLDATEAFRIGEGLKQWHGQGIAAAPMMDFTSNTVQDPFRVEESGFDREHSPLLYLVSAAPLMAWPHHFDPESATYWRWLARLPFLACGVFLGASLWYVARRLCGNTGGFVALTFYCFSPSLIQASALWHTEPEIVESWGAFGTIFTAIAVAHTLYAPREVVLWNWRRIVLLGVSLAIAVGSEFPMIVLVPLALGFLLYVAPVRRRAGLVIWLAACGAGIVVLFAFYFFHPHVFAESLRHAIFWGATWRGFMVPGVYKQVGVQILRACPALVLVLPVALVTYAVWPRTRYFGTTAPLLVAVVFLALWMAHPDLGGAGFLLAAIPFLFIFVAGVLADLMETRYGQVVSACVVALLAIYALRILAALAHVPRG
ncbi:conserved membrane hypothetical protein [Candidatus Sulfotelmatobacter kueseliae]|uniref:Glycosyltransferase RgtA/B/C/D-like domain-containing protein n=1 Tax=Candidatus Sulfotelmatobacter kueseliae TaxID=2042962 RepID=A0A2U3K4Q4_9BACT|nr:conserved membrane hypothetical protein [Candidatus Sulfotelmatobacter kueseliae]